MSFRQEFVDTVCDATQYIKAMSTLMIFFGLLSLVTLAIGTPGTSSYTLAVVNFGIAVLFVTTLAVVFWFCQRRPEAYKQMS